MLHPNYVERVKRNLRAVVDENGYTFTRGTGSISGRQLYRIEKGESIPTISTLQLIANDLEVDMLELFRE